MEVAGRRDGGSSVSVLTLWRRRVRSDAQDRAVLDRPGERDVIPGVDRLAALGRQLVHDERLARARFDVELGQRPEIHTCATVPDKREPPFASAAPRVIAIRSGRTVTSAIVPAARSCPVAGATTWSLSLIVSTARSPSTEVTASSAAFNTPTKSATNGVAGRSYTSRGEPRCSTTPSFITAIRSDIDSASSWSCVT